MKTISAKPSDIQHNWYVIDASGKILGRLASMIALRLRGKYKTNYTPHVDTGDYVIVLNASKIHITGQKEKKKNYYHTTGYVGNLKSKSLSDLITHNPEFVLKTAVKGMLPKNALGRVMFRKLKVYSGQQHPHVAQNPINILDGDHE